MKNQRLPVKLGLLAGATIIAVALAIAAAALFVLDPLALEQSKKIQSAATHALQEKMRDEHNELIESGVQDVQSFIENSRAEFLAGLKNYHLGGNGHLYIVEDNGKMVFMAQNRQASDFHPEDLKRILAQTSGFIEAVVGGRPSLVTLGSFKQWKWRIVLVMPVHEINAPRNHFLLIGTLILMTSLALGVILFAWVATRFVRPLRSLSQQVSSIGADTLGQRIEISESGVEVAELHQALELMTKRLHAAISEKKLTQE